MVEIGTSGLPWRAAAIAIGSALAAETDGAHAVWFPAALPVDIPVDLWAAHGGALARAVPDPTDVADPVVTASAALLVLRRATIGVLGWDPGTDAARAARTVATLADLAPGRSALAVAGTAPDRVVGLAAALRADLAVDLSVHGADPMLAARLGWGWLATAAGPETLAKAASDAGVTGRLGVHLPVVVHPDATKAQRAATTGLLGTFRVEALGEAIVIGDATVLGVAIDAYVAAGVTRIALENLTPFGVPEELEASQAAIRAAVRSARLRHRISA